MPPLGRRNRILELHAVSNTATGAVGLYDTVNGAFNGNANPSSATFIGGPALLVPQPEQRHTIITLR